MAVSGLLDPLQSRVETLDPRSFPHDHASGWSSWERFLCSGYLLSVRFIECRGFESHPRQLIFSSEKVTALGVLCCLALFVCLTLLASFFLPSHLSFKTCI